MRTVRVEPPELGTVDGLAYARFRPAGERLPGGVVVLHGAGSCKESHFDFARRLRGTGIEAIAFDQRGHGDSAGALGSGAIDDVATIAGLLDGPVALRGSSMGGFMALAAGAALGAAAVVAICPASSAQLRRGLRERRYEFRVEEDALDALLEVADERAAARALGERLMLLHAEGDETVPVQGSRDLHEQAVGSRLVTVPGGHHRSVQHDGELQALSVSFIRRALTPVVAPPGT